MDLKIGKVTWEDDVDEAFKERRKNKWPLKEVAGFSILGYMVCTYFNCHEYCMWFKLLFLSLKQVDNHVLIFFHTLYFASSKIR